MAVKGGVIEHLDNLQKSVGVDTEGNVDTDESAALSSLMIFSAVVDNGDTTKKLTFSVGIGE